MSPRRRRRRGFTLIELLVVISIIGILVGLLLPAIGAAREAGRRAQCQSNMHNVTLGILGYVNQKNVFPPSGEFCEDPTKVNPADPTTSAILSWLPGSTTQTGVPMYSWVVPILPFLDAQEMSDQWTMWGNTSTGIVPVSYVDQSGLYTQLGQASNHKIAQSAMKVLQCPDDNTVQIGQGNLSYVVNGGFTLFHAIPAGWNPAANGTAGTDGAGGPVLMQWGVALSTTPQWVADMANTSKLGVFFPESTMPQGNPTRIPWNIRSSIAGIPDGASATLMLSENTLAGVGGIPPYAQTVLGETNWACPLPQFATFIGSSSVCGALTSSPVNCTNNSMLQPTGDNDSQFWAFANRVGTFSNINGARTLTLEGSYPFSNSGHPAGCNMGFCDGAVRFISNTIDGTVYSKIITPSGSKLPTYLKQMPVEQDAFVN